MRAFARLSAQLVAVAEDRRARDRRRRAPDADARTPADGTARCGRVDRPPPTRTWKPTTPSARCTAVTPMSLISGYVHQCAQPVIVILNLRGRLRVVGVAVHEAIDVERDRGGVDQLIVRDAGERAAGDGARVVAARALARPADGARARPRSSGTSSMRSQCSWKFWRLVMSIVERA